MVHQAPERHTHIASQHSRTPWRAAAGKAFKAKSYNLQYPANQTAIKTISAALASNQAGWVQLSAFGVSLCTWPRTTIVYLQHWLQSTRACSRLSSLCVSLRAHARCCNE